MSAESLTITDIARLSGVSKKSVSRVLNDEKGVSDATRERVKAIMAQYGYRPDRRARALASKRSYLLALAYNNPNPTYVLGVLNGMLPIANQAGYEVIVHPLPYPTNKQAGDALLAFMRRSGCDGLVLIPPLSESPDVLTALSAAGISVVRIAGDDIHHDVPHVRFDDRAAALEITSRLIQDGHSHIGFVGGPADSGPTRRRLAGFRDALRAASLDLQEDYEGFGQFTFFSGVEVGKQLLSLAQPPSAIMCCNDEMAAGVINAAGQLGVAVPEKLAVTGFDDSPIAKEVWPPLSTVHQPVKEMAASAAERLLQVIEQPSSVASSIVNFAHSLVIRQSGCQRKS